jgi:hypothetical protein
VLHSDRVYKYNTSGGSLGDWALVAANSSPTGITIDPSGSSTSIWVVDSGSDTVYEYLRDTGAFVGSFALDAGNTNPQGIADPPPASSSLPTADLTVQEPNDKAPISLFAALELDASRFNRFSAGNRSESALTPQDDGTANARWYSAPPTYLPITNHRDALFARYGVDELSQEDVEPDDEAIDSVFSEKLQVDDLVGSASRPS